MPNRAYQKQEVKCVEERRGVGGGGGGMMLDNMLLTFSYDKKIYSSFCCAVIVQETLIVWSEDDSCDLALSFQEKAGCDEVWSMICEVSF